MTVSTFSGSVPIVDVFHNHLSEPIGEKSKIPSQLVLFLFLYIFFYQNHALLWDFHSHLEPYQKAKRFLARLTELHHAKDTSEPAGPVKPFAIFIFLILPLFCSLFLCFRSALSFRLHFNMTEELSGNDISVGRAVSPRLPAKP